MPTSTESSVRKPIRLSFVAAALCVVAACGGGGTPGGGVSTSANPLTFQVDPSSLQVPEGGTAALRFKVSGVPKTPATVALTWQSGDQDISVVVAPPVTVSTDNWNTYQSITLAAAMDEDHLDGTATLRLSAADIAPLDVVVTEQDRGLALSTAFYRVDAEHLQIAEGQRASLGVSLARAPAAAVSVRVEATDGALNVVTGQSLAFDATNWNKRQTVVVTAAGDADSCNVRASLRLISPGAQQLLVPVTVLDDERPANVATLICGTVTAPQGVVVDSDVNDPDAPYAPNDTLGQAQPLPNPVSLGGYVNVPGSGPAGRSHAVGDQSDFYAVDLVQGQSVALHIGEPTSADLDLYLYDSTGTLVDSSVGDSAVESLEVPATGSYIVEVFACSVADACARDGGSNYWLSIGQKGISQASQTLRLSSNFVPGELIGRWKSATNTKAMSVPLPGTVIAGAPEQGALLQIPSRSGSLSKAVKPTRAVNFADAQQETKLATLLAVKQLRGRPDVLAADPNYRLQVLALPNDPLFDMQWHLRQINLPDAWDITTGSDRVIVAVVDTGVLSKHPDLQGKLVAGYDFVSDVATAGDGDGVDPDPEDPGDQDSPAGSSFHGTHTSGTIAAASNNGVGVAGVAWNVKVMPLRALGRGGGTEFDAQEAVKYAAGLPNASGRLPARRADVLNMSFGGPDATQTGAALFDELRKAGVIAVAASGNKTSDLPTYPAAYDSVISVSAVDYDRKLAWYSNFGSTIDVAAPGGDTGQDRNGDGLSDGVVSTGGSDASGSIQFRYPSFQGTSMAAPHVAGVIALMKSVYPALTPDTVMSLLARGKITQDLGVAGRDDQFGYGLIDAYKAVREAQALANGGVVPPPEPRLAADPAAINLGNSLAGARIDVRNAGGGSLPAVKIQPSQPWLSVLPVTVDAAGLGSYDLRVDRSGLSPGTYTATLEITAGDLQSSSVSVIMQVARQSTVSNLGPLHVVLYEMTSHRVASESVVRPENGVYRFTLRDPPPGAYHVFAGTDINQNASLCDGGEICGAYRTVAQPNSVVVVADDVGGIDFGTSLVVELSSASLSLTVPR
jgi:serine protease